MTTEPEGTVTWALAYASHGWPVFPCQPGGKEPATRHGFRDATTDPGQVRRWWERLPAANLAIATGLPGPDVLWTSTCAARREAVSPPTTDSSAKGCSAARARSPPLRAAACTSISPAATRDLAGLRATIWTSKASGGYVLAPPSQVNGRPYRVVSRQAASGVLDWATAVGLLDPRRHKPTPPSRLAPGDLGHLAAWVERLGEGNRNSGLFWAACRALEAGEPGGLDDLAAAAASAGLDDREIARTIASARRTIQRPSAAGRTESHPVPARPGPGRGVYAELDGIPQAAGQARALVRDLLVSELVSNKVAHSRSGRPGGTLAIAVETALRPGNVDIQVRDDGGLDAPAPAAPGPDNEHGRGLAIVTALAAEWSTQTGPAGRSTWCRLNTSPRPNAVDRSPEREAGC
ncbi:MAG TPA: bifunctional DNA primase/polymerase [Streptosporangiaceae bacterium]|nr:bifunctional DNA primase/polymerase [Streptosporangiaceae bacterium]HVB44677.1 bifunctional DNA primase/polymerase [Streptosporangiaceae bacterium]